MLRKTRNPAPRAAGRASESFCVAAERQEDNQAPQEVQAVLSTPLDWALGYAATGMRVFPVSGDKRPLTPHGVRDGSIDQDTLSACWGRWPHADAAWSVPAEVVVVDLDVKHGECGLAGFREHEGRPADDVETPQAISPTGGRHLVFDAQGARHANSTRITVGGRTLSIDLRAEGGYVILPGAGNGRRWLKPLSMPMAAVPNWIPRKAEYASGEAANAFQGRSHPYAVAALRNACDAIASAPCGAQEDTRHRKCFSIGGFVGAGYLDATEALGALTAAAHRMPAHRGPWRGLDRLVARSVEAGMQRPRPIPRGPRP
jgi:hypothetical protein